MDDHRKRAKHYHEAICRILLHDWDPIGVADIPEASDEYDMYANSVAEILMRGQPKEIMVEYLCVVETENMGLQGNRDRNERVAERLLQLREEIDGEQPKMV